MTFFNATILTLGSLFPIMNPFSTAPLFVSLTANASDAWRRKQAFMACVYAFAILAVFLLAGSAIIDFFGISIPGIRVAGGMIIISIGFRMLMPPATQAPSAANPQSDEDVDIAFAPIAMPSLAGPGAIGVVIGAAAQIQSRHPDTWEVIYGGVVFGLFLTLVLALMILRLSSVMVRFLGKGGIDAMTRIFGFLLVCIGSQFLLTGIADFFGIK
jgi:multiple antibiotic resistance protein